MLRVTIMPAEKTRIPGDYLSQSGKRVFNSKSSCPLGIRTKDSCYNLILRGTQGGGATCMPLEGIQIRHALHQWK